MWGIWFLISAVFFCMAAYFLKKRGSYVYAPKDVVYSTVKETPPAPTQVNVRTEQAPIDAEYSIDSRSANPGSPPAQAAQTTSFFSEMSGVQVSQEPENVQVRPSPPKPEHLADAASADAGENEPPPSLKNIRFFDS